MKECVFFMTENYGIEKASCCCFTGHRSRDLPFFGDRDKQDMKCLISNIQLAVENAVDDGYKTFISGMAEGTDLICAEIVHNLIHRKGFDIKLICALPYKNQGLRELSEPLDRYIYSMIIESCDNIVYVCDSYRKDCYRLRNQFMVDNSSRIIGVFKRKLRGSGTLQTINMAKAAGLELNIIDLDSNPVFYIDSVRKL